jgi:hypothetical protein
MFSFWTCYSGLTLYNYIRLVGIAQSVLLLGYSWTIEESGFDSQQGKEIFLFSKASGPPLRPNQPDINVSHLFIRHRNAFILSLLPFYCPKFREWSRSWIISVLFCVLLQQHAKQHAYNQQQIQYHDSVRPVTNAAILNFDFNLYDKIISFTVSHILQTPMFYNLILRQVCSSGPFNMRCEV